jgi:ankyrin repeat protein
MTHTHSLHTQLIEAIECQDLQMVKSLISEGVKINYVNNSSSSTAIEAAARAGDIEIVKFLIEFKADPNKWYSCPPLVVSVDKGFIDIANLLIDSGANVNVDPEFYLTPLSCATYLNSIDLVKKLINVGADVNIWGRESNPPLSLAISYGYKEIYEYMFPLVNLENRNIFIEEGVFLAIDGTLDEIDFLDSLDFDINCRNVYGATPLICAAQYGNESSVRKIIELGAEKTLEDNNGNTALFYAIERNRSEIIKLLE